MEKPDQTLLDIHNLSIIINIKYIHSDFEPTKVELTDYFNEKLILSTKELRKYSTLTWGDPCPLTIREEYTEILKKWECFITEEKDDWENYKKLKKKFEEKS